MTGRKDEMFIVSAVNVFPTDIEYVVRGLEPASLASTPSACTSENFTRQLRGVRRSGRFGSDEPYDQVAKRVDGRA